MPAEIERIIPAADGRTHLIVQCGEQRWHVTLKPVLDFNKRPSGVRYWLRRDGLPPDSDETAIEAALQDIEQMSR